MLSGLMSSGLGNSEPATLPDTLEPPRLAIIQFDLDLCFGLSSLEPRTFFQTSMFRIAPQVGIGIGFCKSFGPALHVLASESGFAAHSGSTELVSRCGSV